jgi:hypothetical protein
MGHFLFCPLLFVLYFSMLLFLVLFPLLKWKKVLLIHLPTKFVVGCQCPAQFLYIPAVVHDARDKQVTYCAEDLNYMHILPACLQVVLNTWPPMQLEKHQSKSFQFSKFKFISFVLLPSIQPWNNGCSIKPKASNFLV